MRNAMKAELHKIKGGGMRDLKKVIKAIRAEIKGLKADDQLYFSTRLEEIEGHVVPKEMEHKVWEELAIFFIKNAVPITLEKARRNMAEIYLGEK